MPLNPQVVRMLFMLLTKLVCSDVDPIEIAPSAPPSDRMTALFWLFRVWMSALNWFASIAVQGSPAFGV